MSEPFQPFYASQMAARPVERRERTVTPAAAKTAKPNIRMGKFRPCVRGSLRGFLHIAWPAAGLRFRNCGVFVRADGTAFVGLPSAPVIDSGGRHHVVDGKKQYEPTNDWLKRERGDEFSQLVLALLLKKYPDALDAPETGAPR